MKEEIRKEKLKTLVGHLLTKYELSHYSINHICFKIKPKDIIEIVEKYNDILITSNLFISKYNDVGNFSYNTDKFKVFTCQDWLFIESQEYERKNNFKIHIEMDKVTEIEVDISCETILSFHFKHPNMKLDEQISFRND